MYNPPYKSSRIAFLCLSVLGISVIALSLLFRPVPILTENELRVVSGSVNDIQEEGDKDIVFYLEAKKGSYYINRGLEQGLDINSLRRKLIGKTVEIKFPDLNILQSNGSPKHASKIYFGREVIFTEVD